LFGCSHGKGTGPMLWKNLGTKFDVCNIFEPNVPLGKDVENWGSLVKTLQNKIFLL
jgi:hypothetical protein